MPPGLGADFPGGSHVKESVCNVGDPGSIPGLGRSPGDGNGNPLQCILPGEFHGQRSLVGYNSWGHKELDTNEQLNTAYTYIYIYISESLCHTPETNTSL